MTFLTMLKRYMLQRVTMVIKRPFNKWKKKFLKYLELMSSGYSSTVRFVWWPGKILHRLCCNLLLLRKYLEEYKRTLLTFAPHLMANTSGYYISKIILLSLACYTLWLVKEHPRSLTISAYLSFVWRFSEFYSVIMKGNSKELCCFFWRNKKSG